MLKSNPLIPVNELERIISLAELDLDYTDLQDQFKDLTHLAAKIAGTEISLVNLIDSFTQWTVSRHGLNLSQMPREDSVCQYTINENQSFEVRDLSADERFKDKFYVNGPLSLKYYFGIPLTTHDGHNIGALCVADKKEKKISPEQAELLKIVADELVNRLNSLRVISNLKQQLAEAKETQKKIAHDIRGPIAGIIGLASLVTQQGTNNQVEEMLEFISMIHKSGKSVLELADEILNEHKKRPLLEDEFNLQLFKEKLEDLFEPQARNKQINLSIWISQRTQYIPFSKNKLLQITGNLISNALKFTPAEGNVKIELDLSIETNFNLLKIKITDSGIGMNNQTINSILHGHVLSSTGTDGEIGYGFGLSVVKGLVEGLDGQLTVQSQENRGTTFEILIRQKQQ
ncbi:GAF domain-containing sensor histidine kinase [Pedobacter sp. L105]|uniref:GAF domain-containing sensor histidine kinase n=1 Tax=Pedobacter sp. L105 TaxID=1641871 RepID=UPI00131C14FC|nr:GAF domain-containing sensor histidine kinase [Pedobacter sp. L105]